MRYFSLSSYFKRVFGMRVSKISVDAGFTCPNRDGRKGEGGCIYCNNLAFTGPTAKRELHIEEQIRRAIGGREGLFIIYFQPFTNTYADPDFLRKLFEIPLSFKNVAGISIGTRPDCLGEDVVKVLRELHSKTHLWVELGLQSASDETLRKINRGHTVDDFLKAVDLLKRAGIRTCVHVIIGLPGEGMEDFLRTGSLLAHLRVEGVKFHNIQVLKDTRLEEMHMRGEFIPLSLEEYVEAVTGILEILPPYTVIHRLAGEADAHYIVAPQWARSKQTILSSIQRRLEELDTWQGKKFAMREDIFSMK